MKDLKKKQYELLRIPKTGSESLKQAFMSAPLVLVHNGVEGHGVTMWEVPERRTPIVTLRDPIQRFRSGYDMNFRDNEANIRERYPTADDLALDIKNVMYNMEWGFTYLPQSYWCRGAEYVKDREAIWILTPMLDQFMKTFSTKGMRIPASRHNSHEAMGGQRSKLSPIAMKAIEEAYASDYQMLKDLGVPESFFTHYNYNGVYPREET